MRTSEKCIGAALLFAALLLSILPLSVTIQELVQPTIAWMIIGFLLYLGYRHRSPRLGFLLVLGSASILMVPEWNSSQQEPLGRLIDMTGVLALMSAGGAAVFWLFRVILGWPTSVEGRDLIQSSLAGDLDTVRYLLDRGVDPDSRLPDGRTALMAAGFEGRLEVTRGLLRRHAAVNLRGPKGTTALLLAVIGGHDDTAALLVANGANPNQRGEGVTPLIAAAHSNCSRTTALLLSRGARVEAESSDGFNPVHAAAQQGASEALAILLDHGAPVGVVNSEGKTAVELAVGRGHGREAALLVRHGAVASGKLHHRLMMLLASAGETEALWKMLHELEDATARANYLRLALKEAVMTAQTQTVASLLTQSVDLNAPIDGDPLLVWAIGYGQTETVRLLLEHGADPLKHDRLGAIPLEIAERQGLEEIAELLRVQPANPARKGPAE